jgi:8-amino-7-oxononanoate synthase
MRRVGTARRAPAYRKGRASAPPPTSSSARSGRASVRTAPTSCPTLINFAGEFIYSTYLAPASAAAALAAIERVRALATERPSLQALSVEWRDGLCAAGFAVPSGDSPIIPLILGDSDVTLRYAEALRGAGFIVSAIRPPTVPVRTGRIRISLRRGLPADSLASFLSVLKGVSA